MYHGKCDLSSVHLFCKLTVKHGLEKCTTGDRCPEGMECQSGVCACVMGSMTDDRKFCLKSDEKLLGDYCNPAIDTCYQLSGRGDILWV